MDKKQKFTCKKCGGKLRIMQTQSKTGLYCSECGAWNRWLKRKVDVSEAYNELISGDEIKSKAIKKVVKYSGNTIIRCEKCDCQLYSAAAPRPLGQFDLLNASFCPQCGVEFVNDQKKFKK